MEIVKEVTHRLATAISERAVARAEEVTPIAIGAPLSRIDGVAKVTGAARYPSDIVLPNLAHARLVTSTIARGRMTLIDTAEATALLGVLAVITHQNAPRLRRNLVPQLGAGRWSLGRDLRPLQDDRIHYAGQAIAIAVAETYEQAIDAAARVRVTYESEAADTDLRHALEAGEVESPKLRLGKADYERGDVVAALAAAPVTIEQEYGTPPQTNNPLGLFATVAAWDGDNLTLFDANQGTWNIARSAASVFGLDREQVHVSSPFVGGAFGAGLRAWPHTWLAALAAREVGRPVKLILSRPQMFTAVGRRAQTVQRLALGAERDGRLTAIRHDAAHDTAREENFTEALGTATRYLYSCPNAATRYRTARVDRSVPTYMRCPGESETVFALESALDELAGALGMDPVALRLRNMPERNEESDKPWSSHSLRQCYERGAKRFDWTRRAPEPRSMREGNVLVGLGVATGTYPAYVMSASAAASLSQDGMLTVRTAATDIGPGTATALTQIAADALGLPVPRVRVEIGDSRFPKAPQQGASMLMATIGSAVHSTCCDLREQVATLAAADPDSPLYRVKPKTVLARDGALVHPDDASRRDPYENILARAGREGLDVSGRSMPLGSRLAHSSHAFAAQFAEVHVDVALRTIRVPRLLGVYGVGRVINPKLAESQLSGGMLWGMSQALFEETTYDHRLNRIVNASLGDYLMPVHADVGSIEVEVIPEDDPYVNPIGVKGLGEIGMGGVAAAIANAVYHATGVRVRELPITIEKLVPDSELGN
ncbi:MAG: xanthine dehydrogenase family protein molybdopterin-binding subunit [Thermomicrobiales bacterium]